MVIPSLDDTNFKSVSEEAVETGVLIPFNGIVVIKGVAVMETGVQLVKNKKIMAISIC